MAHYKPYTQRRILLEISFEKQILPGTLEYTINDLVENQIDTSSFESHYKNDATGATAYDPKVLLKIVLYAYACGIVSCRKIAKCCRENIIFMALCGGAHPHFTTIAHFISSMGEEIEVVFRDVLKVCDQRGLIGKEVFALDGCKLSSHASKEWSGTKEDFEKKLKKLEEAMNRLEKEHEEKDSKEQDVEVYEREAKQLKKLRAKAEKLRDWLDENDEKIGRQGKAVKSNLTDNESAKMKSSHGVIQGYDGLSMVDKQHQIVVYAQAFGEGQEQHLLSPMMEGSREAVRAIGGPEDVFEKTQLLADAGFHSEANMEKLFEEGVDAYVADNLFRKRDPRFADAARHKPKKVQRKAKKFTPRDFVYDQAHQSCICSAGKRMYLKNQHFVVNGHRAVCFQGKLADCRVCALRKQCLKKEDQKTSRQVCFFDGKAERGAESFTDKMKRKIDSWKGRLIYGFRLGIVEPVFGNLENNIGLTRFTLRGKLKVNIQWKLFNIIHNIGKIYRYGYLEAH